MGSASDIEGPPKGVSLTEDSNASFSFRATLAIAALLLLPFVVRTVTNVEPYPAILLPSGAGSVALSHGVVTFPHLSVYGRLNNGDLVAIDPRYLLAPIPVQALDAIATSGFGQGALSTSSIVIRRVGTYHPPRVQAALPQRAGARAWLGANLLKMGCEANELIVRFETSEVDMHTGSELSRTARNEFSIVLR